jgi:hypothetical protein
MHPALTEESGHARPPDSALVRAASQRNRTAADRANGRF